ncbi:ATP-binding protein [Thiomicrorhabdus sp. ZW0627]|uniref:hybrid sensor histidine kinase/response regulator n=1 Tax=Thiomicrorhabdus sp. ZW0627 TaxID=3039774 RepID=UPI0024372A30|nr:ATP-binding protein [Thiomicrorhabdus sp. ZW0627]MDG6773198.1 ATP-binding protein [Thiomicrorhabdus sp. ZW0627]
MSIDNQSISHWMLDEFLWWSYEGEDSDYRIKCSEALQRLFDHPVEKLEDLSGSYDSSLLVLKIQEILNNPEADLRFVCSFETRNGKASYQHRLHVHEREGHRTVFAECIDVTEMVLLEKDIVDAQGRMSLTQVYERQAMLEEQNRLIQESYSKQSRFLALLSHELRSPLLGINSMVTHLKKYYANDEYLVERLRIINLTSEQMMFLVNDILTYSQTEYDAISLHPRRFSLKQSFDYVKQLTKSIAADKGVFVSLVYLGKSDWVYGDSIRLSQILINLIVNAIKFTKLGGVSVEVRQESDDQFSFMVMDSGEGIAEEKLQHIFDPFVQFKTEGATRTLGSGLGLSVVKQLIDLMGGEISVTSTVGVGTTFNFSLTLPVAEADTEADIEERFETVEEDGVPVVEGVQQVELLQSRGYKVLVVDDSKINRMVLSGYLKELDCTVVEAKDGFEAWELFQKDDFDFVFMDIQMPIMDGFQVMEKIQAMRSAGGASHLKAVFAVTAGGGEELIPEGHSLDTLGFEKWLVKPIGKSQVVKLLSKVWGSEEYPDQSEVINKPSDVEPQSLSEPETKEVSEESSEGVSSEAVEYLEDVSNIPENFYHLLGRFAEEFSENLERLHEIVEQAQWQEVKGLAHYMKGNCMVFQLFNCVDMLKDIERLVQEEISDAERQRMIELNIKDLEKALKYLENSAVFRHNTDQ